MENTTKKDMIVGERLNGDTAAVKITWKVRDI